MHHLANSLDTFAPEKHHIVASAHTTKWTICKTTLELREFGSQDLRGGGEDRDVEAGEGVEKETTKRTHDGQIQKSEILERNITGNRFVGAVRPDPSPNDLNFARGYGRTVL